MPPHRTGVEATVLCIDKQQRPTAERQQERTAAETPDSIAAAACAICRPSLMVTLAATAQDISFERFADA
jgi:hypothetical protein